MPTPLVLIADNEEHSLDKTNIAITAAGYRTINANSLIEARRKLLEEKNVALAVLDLRLKDDQDEGDTSGLFLAKTAALEIPKIIYTSHPSNEVIKQASEPALNGLPAVTSIVDKEEGTDALVAEVRGALERKAIRATLPSAAPNGTLLRIAAVVLLPIGLGFGVVAMATSSPWWLLGTVLSGVIAVICMGASVLAQPGG